MTGPRPAVYRSSANLRAERDRLVVRRTALATPTDERDQGRAAALDLRITALNHKITDTLARERGEA